MFTRVNSRCAHHVRPPGEALSGSGYGSARLVRFLLMAAAKGVSGWGTASLMLLLGGRGFPTRFSTRSDRTPSAFLR